MASCGPVFGRSLSAVIYRFVLRPLLFALSAETAHRLTMTLLGAATPLLRPLESWLLPRDPALTVKAFGLTFPTPVGLAAGLDKGAEAFEAFGALGFGFVEVGTITSEAQPGNPQPRLFRLPADRALINRMGFNNQGAQAAAAHIAHIAKAGKRRTVLGINIGKTKVVPNEQAADDYAKSARVLAPLADYMVVNVSSPNTPGLRQLQSVTELRRLLVRVREALDAARPASRLPLLLKIAPDLADEDVDAIADLALELQLEGIIATNTTIRRDGLATSREAVAACGDGGLSGPPVKARSLEVLRRLRGRVGTRVTLISVGGIETVDDAWVRIRAGANLVQVYTALIYAGPLLARRIALGLADRARAAGFQNVAAAVGSDGGGPGQT